MFDLSTQIRMLPHIGEKLWVLAFRPQPRFLAPLHGKERVGLIEYVHPRYEHPKCSEDGEEDEEGPSIGNQCMGWGAHMEDDEDGEGSSSGYD